LPSPIPPVERVRPGLWSIPVPIPSNSLRYVFVYVFETDRGPYIVDTGWNTVEAWAALDAGLADAGTSVGEVQGIVVTHLHPDHYGLAGRVREASGAWIGLHPADAALIHDRYVDPDFLVEMMGAMLQRAGAPSDELQALQRAAMPVLPFVTAATPDILVEDGDKLDIPGWDVAALWTPGHSPGHLCLWEAGNQLMLSGDHVLPRITPNISFHPQAGDDPLGDFLTSLERVARYQAAEVLPGHEHRFVNLAARVAELQEHHERRFAEVVAALADGVTTGWEVATLMKWSRPWTSIEGFMRRAAVLEALAHLRALEVRGVVEEVRSPDGPSRWQLVAGGGEAS
jgi:glyoxylase-like metal-dependent hydrolase (beta-lactamase superfamily II)